MLASFQFLPPVAQIYQQVDKPFPTISSLLQYNRTTTIINLIALRLMNATPTLCLRSPLILAATTCLSVWLERTPDTKSIENTQERGIIWLWALLLLPCYLGVLVEIVRRLIYSPEASHSSWKQNLEITLFMGTPDRFGAPPDLQWSSGCHTRF